MAEKIGYVDGFIRSFKIRIFMDFFIGFYFLYFLYFYIFFKFLPKNFGVEGL